MYYKARARDNQRKKVYVWEDKYLLRLRTNHRLSFSACKELVKTICEAQSVSIPRIKDGRGRKRAGGCATYVTLPKWARNKVIVIHESTHSILDNGVIAWHGPEFMSLFIELLAIHHIATKEQLLRWARKERLQIRCVCTKGVI